ALSASMEAYFSVRNRFAKSIAVLNIGSYILGIGDRHLENFLLDTTDGAVAGIDFGHAFGSATEILPVPELMPFRMTRQICQVTTPLTGESTGLMTYSMIHALTAFHEQRDVLLNTMDVFIKEPLVDWL